MPLLCGRAILLSCTYFKLYGKSDVQERAVRYEMHLETAGLHTVICEQNWLILIASYFVSHHLDFCIAVHDADRLQEGFLLPLLRVCNSEQST